MQMLSNSELNCKQPGTEMKLFNLLLMAQSHVSIGVMMAQNQSIVDPALLSHRQHRHQQPQPQPMDPLMDQPLKNPAQVTQQKNQQLLRQ